MPDEGLASIQVGHAFLGFCCSLYIAPSSFLLLDTDSISQAGNESIACPSRPDLLNIHFEHSVSAIAMGPTKRSHRFRNHHEDSYDLHWDIRYIQRLRL